MNAQRCAEGGALQQFQDAFAQALLDPDSDPASSIARLVRQPGFAVYRNTVMKGCIDALQANYPSVARLVGDEWFRAAAAIFVRGNPPSHPSLLDYGAGFAAFLAQFPPAAELPYLAGVATVDRFWSEAHGARDEPPLAASEVAHLDRDTLGRSVLRPHASARWHWFQDLPIAALWRRNRVPGAGLADEIEWCGEGILLVRPQSEVTHVELDIAACAFLDACDQGHPAAEAALAALRADAGADLSRLMSGLLEAGAFAGLQTSENSNLQGTAP
ncbi:MAG: DUF2063 domain-containing protein [Betaproteobacteria bacterium]|nr:DUF2063 domain-containing protein [Betaproteobacteria bacterium]